MATAKLADVKMVLSTRHYSNHAKRLTGEAQVAYSKAKLDFGWKATLATWSRLVAASRRLHATVKAEQAERARRERAT